MVHPPWGCRARRTPPVCAAPALVEDVRCSRSSAAAGRGRVASALVIDQEVIWQGGSGYADLPRKTPATPNTPTPRPRPLIGPSRAARIWSMLS